MICISAGHHPQSKGASFGDFNEHDEAVLWASRIKHILGDKAMLVPFDVLRKKVNFINAMKPKMAIEIHFNSAVDETGKHIGEGCETLYYPNSNKGKELAEVMQKSLSELFQPDRGAKEGWYRMDKKNGPDYFLARTNCVSLILEPEFIHRRDVIEANRLQACEIIATVLHSIGD